MSECTISVTVCVSLEARQYLQIALELPAGAPVTEAIRQSGVLLGLADESIDALQIGVWGRKCTHDAVICDGDRVELYRPLKVDPKTARRERFSRQGAKSAGLFSKRRAGAKSGY